MKFVNLWVELTIGGNRIKNWLAGEGGATGGYSQMWGISKYKIKIIK